MPPAAAPRSLSQGGWDSGIAQATEALKRLSDYSRAALPVLYTAAAAAASEYFAEARLTRQFSRDEALQLLQTAATAETASQETIDSAMSAISAMATCSKKETQIENLLIAKDFTDCVVYIGNDSVTVAVPAPSEGLSEEAVARITDIICSETEYAASQLNIIEVRA